MSFEAGSLVFWRNPRADIAFTSGMAVVRKILADGLYELQTSNLGILIAHESQLRKI